MSSLSARYQLAAITIRRITKKDASERPFFIYHQSARATPAIAR